MNVTLNLSADKSIQQTLDAPCKGVMAKALGKYRLEEKFGGTVVFDSYQEAPTKPKTRLDDDTPVIRGSILNFTVSMDVILRRQALHDKMISMLSEPMLQDLVSRWTARLLTRRVTMPTDPTTKFESAVASDPNLHARLSAALAYINTTITPEEVAIALDSTYRQRCGEISLETICVTLTTTESGSICTHSDNTHVNTTDVLCRQMEQMRDSGVLELLSAKFPTECLIVQYYSRRD
jgi:hypothetical protein